MAILEGTRAARYDLVTAAHLFLLEAIPFRQPASRQALAAFVRAAAGCDLASPDRDTVLVHLLAALESHTGGRLPSLVDRFVAFRPEIPDGLRRFDRCVEDVIRYRRVGNPHVQQAAAIIHERYGQPGLREATIAAAVELTPSRLCEQFRAQTGLTPMEYLQGVRLDHAARMLVDSTKSVKEILGAVGYTDGASFDHSFKRRFGESPTEYRARGIRRPTTARLPDHEPPTAPAATPCRRILIVDDNESTRETLGFRFRRFGYTTDLAGTGAEALACASATRPDAIVLDVHLPDMSGFDCLRELRRRRPGLGPPVVLFTADWEVEREADEAHALGATIVSKLCDVEEVERTIASLCAMHRTAPS